MGSVLAPRIYIGAGGSGRRMVALIKRAVESDPNLTPEERQGFQFLAIDADEYQNDCKPLDPDTEYVHIAGFRPTLARQADYMAEPVKDWWYDSYTPPYIQQGAGAVRLIGRLCYFYHYPRIRDAFQQALQRATGYSAGKRVAGEVAVYIIGSLAGGTGSAMLLDLAFMARQTASYRQIYVNAAIMLPDVFTVTQVLTQQKFKDRWMANGYAALKELVWFNERPQEFKPFYRAAAGREEPVDHPRMFDQMFFIEPVLGNTSTVASGDNIFQLAAQSLYLFSASAHGSGAGSVLVNTDGVHYASLGMQSIEFPQEYVQRYARHWATARLLERLVSDGGSLAEERGAREQLHGDLQAAGWADLGGLAEQSLSHLSMPEALELDPEGDLGAEASRAADRYKSDLNSIRERLQGWSQSWVRELPGHWEARVQQLLGEGRSLGWLFAYLTALESELGGQVRRMEESVTRQGREQTQEEQRLRQTRPLTGLGKLLGGKRRRTELAEELEDKLEELYTDQIPRRLALEAVATVARHFLSQWVQPRLHRFARLREWAHQTEIGHQSEQAQQTARQLDELEHYTPHTYFSLRGRDLEPLVAARLEGADFGSEALKPVWRWISEHGDEASRELLIQELQEAVTAAAAERLNMTLLDSWAVTGDEQELRDRFRAAALSCRPFWSYVEEQAGEHMTRVAVLAMPADPKWEHWLRDLRLDLKRVDGDPRRVVFLTVEGCRHLKDVHLKELPEWFRTYEQVQRAYDLGLDERPVHAHRHWRSLPEVDPTLPVNPGRLFGPAMARGLIRNGDGTYLLQIPPVSERGFPGEAVRLGRSLEEAMQSLVCLHEPAAGALRAYMEIADRRELANGLGDALEALRQFSAGIRAEGELRGERRALVLQTEAYLHELRRKKLGMAPETDRVH